MKPGGPGKMRKKDQGGLKSAPGGRENKGEQSKLAAVRNSAPPHAAC